MINDIFNILLPQICLLLFIALELIFTVFFPKVKPSFARLLSALGISTSIVLLSTVQTEPQYFGLRGAIMSDSYTLFFHFVIYISTMSQ